MTEDRDTYVFYRKWFYAAAIYNVVWGGLVSIFPGQYFDFIGMERPTFLPIWSGVGMMVLVFGLGYYYIARDPERYGNFVWIGLLGKTLGPFGGALAILQGQLPPAFAWTFLMNDLIWWPVFWSFALKFARNPFLR